MNNKLAVALTILVLVGTALMLLVSSPPFTTKADSFIPKNRPAITYQSPCGAA